MTRADKIKEYIKERYGVEISENLTGTDGVF